MVFFAAVGGAHGSLVKLKCPHCDTVQARARGKPRYRCSACHRYFDAAEGQLDERRPRPRSGARRR